MGSISQGPSSGQFLRFGQLVVSKGTGASQSLGITDLGQVGGVTTFSTGVKESPSYGIDLSNLRFRFEVRASDVETPNTLAVRVYNVSEQTANRMTANGGAEFDIVTLSAGYQNGNQGIIFQGDIKQYRTGRERNVDSYVDILAGDGDQAYNQSVINQSFPAGSTQNQQLSALAASMNLPTASSADGLLSTGGVLPRGKTLFGMARLHMATLAQANNVRWSIQNGVVTLVPVTGYLPGQAVQINSATGMIGTPEQTDNGIVIRCYLNPLIKIGQLVQINNKDINQATLKSQMYPSYTSLYYPATVTNDGYYRVLVHECVGDTRGNDWYSELTCLAADTSASNASSVLPNG